MRRGGDGVTLAGATVVVTRPDGDADELADALRRKGARVLAVPAIEITDPDDGGAALAAAVAKLERYRWVVCTSANAARRLLALLPDPPSLRGAALGVVGPATAAVFTQRQLAPDLVATRTTAEGLADAFPAAPPAGGAVLFPAAEGARRTLPEALRAKGWAVDQVVAYRTVRAPRPAPSVVEELSAAAAVTFASPSAVDAYAAWRDEHGRPLPVPPVVACIGPVTAAAARAAGMAPRAVAPDASVTAFVRVLEVALAEERGRGPR